MWRRSAADAARWGPIDWSAACSARAGERAGERAAVPCHAAAGRVMGGRAPPHRPPCRLPSFPVVRSATPVRRGCGGCVGAAGVGRLIGAPVGGGRHATGRWQWLHRRAHGVPWCLGASCWWEGWGGVGRRGRRHVRWGEWGRPRPTVAGCAAASDGDGSAGGDWVSGASNEGGCAVCKVKTVALPHGLVCVVVSFPFFFDSLLTTVLLHNVLMWHAPRLQQLFVALRTKEQPRCAGTAGASPIPG